MIRITTSKHDCAIMYLPLDCSLLYKMPTLLQVVVLLVYSLVSRTNKPPAGQQEGATAQEKRPATVGLLNSWD
jgi:hypothetical protein